MNNNYIITYIFFGLFAILATSNAEIELSVKITSEDNAPIEGAKIIADFKGYLKEQRVTVSGTTDAEGCAIIKGCSKAKRINTSVDVTVNAEGSYFTTVKSLSDNSRVYDLNLTLRKRIKPIALYAKKASLTIPIDDGWVAYDFKKGDLVEPHGLGKESDIFFKVSSLPTEDNGTIPTNAGMGKMLVKFPNTYDGLIYEKAGFIATSEMVMPHQAHLEGYVDTLVREEPAYHNINRRRGVGIFMRVRSQSNEDGSLKQANYAKLNQDFRFDPRESGWHVDDQGKPKTYGHISFTYYFNPMPNDRNLEFDPDKNLFGELEWDEVVRAP